MNKEGSKLKQYQSNCLESILKEYGGLMALFTGRIVGGNETTIEHIPWIVSLRLLGSHRCGGSIISTTRVLTAAHCTAGLSASLLEIRAGSTSHGTGGQTRPISRFVNHPYYSSSTLKNDISLLHFTTPLNTNLPTISIIPLPDKAISAPVGSLSQVSGWGATCESCSISTALRYVMIPIISNYDCNVAYEGSVTDGMLCAAYPEGTKDACFGDSGGPATYNNFLEGIVSWGTGCARPNFPGVYTRVSYYRDWIDENI